MAETRKRTGDKMDRAFTLDAQAKRLAMLEAEFRTACARRDRLRYELAAARARAPGRLSGQRARPAGDYVDTMEDRLLTAIDGKPRPAWPDAEPDELSLSTEG